MSGIKHLIECHCFLSIFKNNKKLINHRFPVYSKIDEYKNLIPKLVKCNNCEALHHVSKVGRSELRPGKDQTMTTLSIADIKINLPLVISNYLIENNCDISSFEHAKDIIDENRWGEIVVVKRDIIDEKQQVKYIKINSKNNFEINTSLIQNIVIKD